MYKGEGVPRNQTEAIRYYKMAADQGDPGAQTGYAMHLLRGDGIPRDINEARRYLKLAVGQGHPGAQTIYKVFDLMYSDSDIDVTDDCAGPARDLKMAADRGDAEAQVRYAAALENGEDVPCDIEMSMRYYKMAADQGHPEGQFKYGYGLLNGYLVDGREQAYRYLLMAAEQGHEEARSTLFIYSPLIQALFGDDSTSDHFTPCPASWDDSSSDDATSDHLTPCPSFCPWEDWTSDDDSW